LGLWLLVIQIGKVQELLFHVGDLIRQSLSKLFQFFRSCLGIGGVSPQRRELKRNERKRTNTEKRISEKAIEKR
jgi:hypothetical protein